MLEYIYFVKCPGCEDEHFYFFDEAKDFAMSLLSKKPVITQTEVNRNDFGECTDHCDLGTVWSWEDMMKDTTEPTQTVFKKADTLPHSCDGSCSDNCACGKHHEDPEFAALDNSVDAPIRKPVPADKSIEDLVEEMEENEDEVECKWCGELFGKDQCRREVDLGWLCDRCQAAIMSRGEQLTFREGPLDEAMDPHDLVELEYDSLTVTIYGEKRAADDWDEFEHTDSFVYSVPRAEVEEVLWNDLLTDEDVKEVPGGFEALEDDTEWSKFISAHFDDLFEKYNKQILEYFKEEAEEDFRERAQEEYSMGEWAASQDYSAYDEQLDTKHTQKTFLEEFDDAETHKTNLTDCPECGAVSYDMKEQYCGSCGFNL